MSDRHLTKDDVTSIKRQLISGAASIEDAACRAGPDKDLKRASQGYLARHPQ